MGEDENNRERERERKIKILAQNERLNKRF